MFFVKYPHRANFSFADRYDEDSGEIELRGKRFKLAVGSHEGDLYHVQVSGPRNWQRNLCLESLDIPKKSKRARLKAVCDDDGLALELAGRSGPLFRARFGASGDKSMFALEFGSTPSFYGMGEKTFGKVELSGFRAKFWNTDVWGDFHFAQWGEHPTDPSYFSLPYLAVRVGDECFGLLVHNPYPAYMETPGSDESRVFVEWQRTSPLLQIGSEGGQPNLWVIYGPTIKEVTRKLQKLIGVTPLPPAWALGYHQSRWGYGGHDDLLALDEQFEKHGIPCDSLWLDLDYMNGYRVFDTNPEMFPGGVDVIARKLRATGRRIVPILDPGIKSEPGNPVYDAGLEHDVYCQNPEGAPFVGMVWPGETVFPDFTLPDVRDWWSGYVAAFANEGFGATWIDMNDPSTGPVDPTDMLFGRGTQPHEAHHNQYSLGMQMATTSGLLAARPDERPFVLSRSGFIGTSKHAAVWSGDNLSNYFYLRVSIPTAIGMSLSGQPFNGPDIGGFGHDATDALMVDWIKCGFLFPFCRNHSGKGTRPQEPFAFDADIMKLIRRYIRLRYKLLPYLYNLFIDQEELGDPVLRPMSYEFEDDGLDLIDDQFLIGPSILQAPFVTENLKFREVLLPGTEPWYDASNGEWIQPGIVNVRKLKDATPLYISAGAILPMQLGTPTDNRKDFSKVRFHIFIPPAWSGESEYRYRSDDGLSFDYRSGVRSSLALRLVAVDGNVAVSIDQPESGFGKIEYDFVVHGDVKSLRCNSSVARLSRASQTLTGKSIKVLAATVN